MDLPFVPARRSWLLAVASTALLSSCGDGCPVICFSDFDKPTTVAWQSARYTLVTPNDGTEPVFLEAVVSVQVFAVLPTDVIVVEPNLSTQNPGPTSASYPVTKSDANAQEGQAVVRFVARVTGGAGSYPKGEFPFTATLTRGDTVVTATTTLVVQ